MISHPLLGRASSARRFRSSRRRAILNDQSHARGIDRSDVIGFDRPHSEHPTRDRWASSQEPGRSGHGRPTSVDQGIFLDSGHFDYVLKRRPKRPSEFLKPLDGNERKHAGIRASPRCATADVGHNHPPLIRSSTTCAPRAPDADGSILPLNPRSSLNFTTRGALQVHLLQKS